jgi:hypothetical protein
MVCSHWIHYSIKLGNSIKLFTSLMLVISVSEIMRTGLDINALHVFV